MYWEQTTINCRGTLLDLSEPVVMAILNLTPDSFFDGGRFTSDSKIEKHLEKLISDGASIIDVGGMSSRPGAKVINSDEESERILPVIRRIRRSFPEIIISVDTIHGKVARKMLDEGAHMINDISAWSFDPTLLDVVVEYQVPYVLMHMQGLPDDMQLNPHYEDVIVEVLDFIIAKLGQLSARGVHDVIVDPGLGFGKTTNHNFELLQNLHVFRMLERPMMVGLSRKGMIQNVINQPATKALNGTTALHMVALQQGARILRAHDVKEAKECIQLWEVLEKHDRTNTLEK